MSLLLLASIAAASLLIAVVVCRAVGMTFSTRANSGLVIVAGAIVAVVAILAPGGKSNDWRLIRAGDAQLVSAATADLHAPAAFAHRLGRCHYGIGSAQNICFTTPRSLVLGRAAMGRLVAASGATPQPHLGGGLKCYGLDGGKPPHAGPNRLFIQQCAETATTRSLLLDFIATSIVRPTSTGPASTSEVLPKVFGGTQLDVVVVAVQQ
jgi:hypothetical protein